MNGVQPHFKKDFVQLEDEAREFRKFHNLRTLTLIECDIGDGCQVLRYILENVPNLETLVLQDCKVMYLFANDLFL